MLSAPALPESDLAPAHADPLTASEAADPAEKRDVSDDPAADDSATGQQLLSTLGAITLGILGLLWMRRRATEL